MRQSARILFPILLAVLLASSASAFGLSSAADSDLAVAQLEVEATVEPLGIDNVLPRFSWRLESPLRGVLQSSFHILVASNRQLLQEGHADLWDSGKVDSGNPWALYAGAPFKSRSRYYWTVRVETAAGISSGWAQPSWFETALLNPSDWVAEWISGPERPTERLTPEQGLADDAEIREAGEFCRPPLWPQGGFFPSMVKNNHGECRELRPAPMLRTSFQVGKAVAQARVYSTGLGYNDLRINGEPTSQSVLDPAFTNFSKTVYYTTHDVTDLIEPGENVISTTLGSGQYDNAARTWDWGWDLAEWRSTPALRLQLHITYEDGTEETVTSNANWKVSTSGPTRYDSYYLGETYDARKEVPGWDRPGFDDSGWMSVRIADAPGGRARAQTHEAIEVVDVLDPGMVRRPKPGVMVYDVGQNLAGWAQIIVNAPSGSAVELFFSEKLNDDGTASDDTGFALVGGQLQTDYYIAKGDGNEVWKPRFSYKGFRYVQVSGPSASPLPEDVNVSVEAIEVVRTAFQATSAFTSGNPLLNQIHANTRWAMQSNVHGIITDTPIYEKNGWTGDAQLSAGMTSILFDTERLYTKMFRDMIDAQSAEGELPLLSPSNENYGYVGKPAFKPTDCCGSTPAWDAFWFIVPWEAYQRFGDLRALEVTYPAMRKYLDLWIPKWTGKDGDEFDHTLTAGLGDWDPPEGTPTNISLASTAYYARFAQIAAEAAHALGHRDDARRYQELFEEIRMDFNARYLAPDGFYRDSVESPFTHTAQAMPLALDLVPPEKRASLAVRLADDIRENRGGNAYVGILGARYILPALTSEGHIETAFQVATQTDYPSWGYWIRELGWTGLGEFWEATSRSRNHHFFGTIVQWMYEDLAGIRPVAPGFREIAIRPEIPDSLTHVAASYQTVLGHVASSWRKTRSGLEVDVTIPPNAVGIIQLPGTDPRMVTEYGTGTELPAASAPSVSMLSSSEGRIQYRLGSGHYRFRVRKNQ